jgi:hypothetical protein
LPVELQVGYAVRTLDLNLDGRLDILITDSKRFLWLENPSWQVHVIHATPEAKNDNVCMAPYDVDRDGHVDLAIGHDWQPNNTRSGGAIGWLKSPSDPRQTWSYSKIGEEPTTHRIQWADVNQDGRSELLVLPLKGRDTVSPGFDSVPVRLLQFEVPAKPESDSWPVNVLDESLHVSHNFEVWNDSQQGGVDILLASYEGATHITFSKDGKKSTLHRGAGFQGVAPARGSSEIRKGRMSDEHEFLATVEPWHGDQIVVYTNDTETRNPTRKRRTATHDQINDNEASAKWMQRTVIDDQLKWGHAVACANLDSDAEDEIVVGVRDNSDAAHRCGVRIYDFRNGKWTRTLLEPGQVAVEDLVVADLNGDGRSDIIAVGRATHNAVIYWNRD